MRAAVLGAAGDVAPGIVRDLAASDEFESLTLLDLDGAGARAVAGQHGCGKATGAAVDGLDRQALTLALEGHQVVINAASSSISLAAMDAAVAAGCNYLDLGGEPDVGEEQLALGPVFADGGLVAILGCDDAPAVARLLAHGGLGSRVGVFAAEEVVG